jgi:hypothetical protein
VRETEKGKENIDDLGNVISLASMAGQTLPND